CPDTRAGSRVRGVVLLRGPLVTGHVKHCSPVRLTCRSNPLRLKVPALVDQATWRRCLMVTESACWPKPPATPFAPPALVSVDASWPISMLVNEASPDSCSMSISRSVAVAGLAGSVPARITRLIPPGAMTDWQRLVSVAFEIPETATGCLLPALSTARPPYWTKPSPTSSSAETLKVDPETANDAAIAPLAMPNTMAPARNTAGPLTRANRRHLVRPRTIEACADFTDSSLRGVR